MTNANAAKAKEDPPASVDPTATREDRIGRGAENGKVLRDRDPPAAEEASSILPALGGASLSVPPKRYGPPPVANNDPTGGKASSNSASRHLRRLAQDRQKMPKDADLLLKSECSDNQESLEEHSASNSNALLCVSKNSSSDCDSGVMLCSSDASHHREDDLEYLRAMEESRRRRRTRNLILLSSMYILLIEFSFSSGLYVRDYDRVLAVLEMHELHSRTARAQADALRNLKESHERLRLENREVRARLASSEGRAEKLAQEAYRHASAEEGRAREREAFVAGHNQEVGDAVRRHVRGVWRTERTTGARDAVEEAWLEMDGLVGGGGDGGPYDDLTRVWSRTTRSPIPSSVPSSST